MLLILATSAVAQSGRVKKKEDKKEETSKPKVSTYNPTQKVMPTPPPLILAPGERPRLIDGDDDEISVDSTLVPIPVSVINKRNGVALTSLGITDFLLKIDDTEVEISELFRSESPVRLALLFDNSSSVTIAREFEQKAAIRFFRRVIRPKIDMASLFSIAGTTNLEQPFTNDVGKLIGAIKGFPPPEGATALNDGIAEASNYLEDYPGRRVIVIVSDGQDTLSELSFDRMVEFVQKNNCQVYIVHTNEFENYKRTGNRTGSANLRALAAERRMQDLARQTGGAVYSPIDEDELDKAFTQIAAEISSQYIIGYYPDDEVRDGRFRKIDVLVKSVENLTVRSRAGYFAGSKLRERN
jgi:Ca-activated chloride channel family protein